MLLVRAVCLLCGVLYMLSWAALVAGVVGMLLWPVLPYTAVGMSIALYYLVGCGLIRLLGRLCGFRQAGPVVHPPAPVVMRRVILEDITPYPADYTTIKAHTCR